MLWCIPSGLIAGFVLGFFGAGGTVIALPVLLFLAGLRPHVALGTNATGVALIAGGLLAWRTSRNEVPLTDGVVFALPGIPGIYLGARLGLIYPGARLVFLLGFLIFGVAGWMGYLSMHKEKSSGALSAAAGRPAKSSRGGRLARMAATAFAIGLAAGFFAIGGGFMIVPALIIVGGLQLAQASSASLVPICAFAAIIAIEYLAAGSVRLGWSAMMLAGGMAGGAYGVWLSKRLSKIVMQRAFAIFLAALGVYIVLR